MIDKVIITGSAGFIGSHLTDFLTERKFDVIGIDDLSGGFLDNVKDKKRLLRIDLKDKAKVDRVIKDFRPGVIFHLAAWAHEGLSQFCPTLITENNYNAYLNVLTSAVKYKVSKIVCGSSMSVYGAGIPPFTEDQRRNPEDIYAIAKTSMERATEIFADVYGIRYTIIRPHNVYGERQNMRDPYRNVIAIFINRILRGLPVFIYGNGLQRRSFSYIADVIPYLAFVGWLKYADGEIINIGPLEEITINGLAGLVMEIMGFKEPPIYMPARPCEVREAWCDNKKAQELLGYKTTVTLREGLTRMIDWAKKKGPQKPRYLKKLEIEREDLVPQTWLKKLI